MLFTIETLQDPSYTGPSSTSWNEVTVSASGPHRVVFTLETPLGGFLQALTQPLAPAHLLADVPVDALADDPFGQQPVGSGPFALVELTDESASLVPAGDFVPAEEDPSAIPSSSPAPPDSLGTPAATGRPSRPQPYLAGIDFRFYDDSAKLAADFRSGVAGRSVRDLAPGGRRAGIRRRHAPAALPGRHADRGPAESSAEHTRSSRRPRSGRPSCRRSTGSRLIDEAYAMSAASATGPIPPSSPMFDPAADPVVPYDRFGREPRPDEGRVGRTRTTAGTCPTPRSPSRSRS